MAWGWLPDKGATLSSLSPQNRSTLLWLVVSVSTLTTISFLFDVALIFILPFAMAGIIAWGILLAARSLKIAWLGGSDGVSAFVPLLGFGASALLLTVLFRPAIQFGGYMQAQVVLALHHADYHRIIADPEKLSPADAKRFLVQVRGDRQDRIIAFGYGGFLSIDRDIVYDVRGQPERRAVALLKATSANCWQLRGHFYDCTLDY